VDRDAYCGSFCCLKPNSTGIVDFIQNASLFTDTISSGTATGTSTNIIGITQDSIVLNIKDGLIGSRNEYIATGLAIVTNVITTATRKA
jgi:hypothetical protein